MNPKAPVVAFLLGLLPAAYLLGVREARAGEGPPDTITARSFVLVDASGRPRGALATQPDGTIGLTLRDPVGNALGVFAIAPDGNPEVALLGADRKPRFRVGVGKDGVGFVLTDVAGNARAGLVTSESATSFSLVDPVSGNTRVMLSAERSGTASVTVHDRAGEARTTLSAKAEQASKPK